MKSSVSKENNAIDILKKYIRVDKYMWLGIVPQYYLILTNNDGESKIRTITKDEYEILKRYFND